MELSIFQAAILAAYYWFAATRIVYSLIHILRGPLLTSLFCGIVLGDVPTAIMIGAMIQPMFLAFTAAIQPMFWPLQGPAAPLFGMRPPLPSLAVRSRF